MRWMLYGGTVRDRRGDNGKCAQFEDIWCNFEVAEEGFHCGKLWSCSLKTLKISLRVILSSCILILFNLS